MQTEIIITGIVLFIFLLALMAATLFIIFTLNQRKFTFSNKLLKLTEEHQKNIHQAQLEIQEQTFNYISQEIHDHIGQRLTLAKLYLNSRQKDNNENNDEFIRQSTELITDAIADLKYLSKTMTADFINDNGLLKAIEQETDRFKKLNNFQLSFVVKGETVFMAADHELIIFRIIQEALQNIMKHAKASNASIVLNYEKEWLQIVVTDNGTGVRQEKEVHDPERKDNPSGINNMKKRTELLGGQFNIQSEKGKGTTLQIKIPIKPM
jgi:signal transduction histidine kinase